MNKMTYGTTTEEINRFLKDRNERFKTSSVRIDGREKKFGGNEKGGYYIAEYGSYGMMGKVIWSGGKFELIEYIETLEENGHTIQFEVFDDPSIYSGL